MPVKLKALAILMVLSQGLLFASDAPAEALAMSAEASAKAEKEGTNPLVDIQSVNPHIRLDIRYATTDNFMKEAVYPEARCLLRQEVAAKISRVQDALEKKGFFLKIFDGYRPLSVQKKMWAKVPVEGFVANPAKGSNHNRGAAVDVTLTDASGKELEMPSAYDEFSERAHRDYAGGTPDQTENRRMLREAMENEGFAALKTEWWHFDDKDAKSYPVLDLPFSASAKASADGSATASASADKSSV